MFLRKIIHYTKLGITHDKSLLIKIKKIIKALY